MLTVNSTQLLDRVDQQILESATATSVKSELILEFERHVYSILGKSRLEVCLRHNYSRFRNARLTKGGSFLKGAFPSYSGYIKLAGRTYSKSRAETIEELARTATDKTNNIAMIEEYFKKAGLLLWPKQSEANVTMLRYPLLVRKKSEIVNQAGKQGLDIAGWYSSPVHPLQEDDLAKVGYCKGSCRKAEAMINQLIHLPTGRSLNEHRLEAMIEIICRIINID